LSRLLIIPLDILINGYEYLDFYRLALNNPVRQWLVDVTEFWVNIEHDFVNCWPWLLLCYRSESILAMEWPLHTKIFLIFLFLYLKSHLLFLHIRFITWNYLSRFTYSTIFTLVFFIDDSLIQWLEHFQFVKNKIRCLQCLFIT